MILTTSETDEPEGMVKVPAFSFVSALAAVTADKKASLLGTTPASVNILAMVELVEPEGMVTVRCTEVEKAPPDEEPELLPEFVPFALPELPDVLLLFVVVLLPELPLFAVLLLEPLEVLPGFVLPPALFAGTLPGFVEVPVPFALPAPEGSLPSGLAGV